MKSRMAAGFAILAAGLTGFAAAPAVATPIAYIFSGTASGTLGGQSFSGLLTVTATGDTADITNNTPGLYRNDVLSTVIDIAGLGPVSVTATNYVFDSQGANKIGFGVNGIPHCCDIIQLVDAAYGAYDLGSAIGPLAFSPDLSVGDWIDVPTSGGLLTLSRYADNSFEAIPQAVPEPGVAAIFLGGLAGLGFLRRKRALT